MVCSSLEAAIESLQSPPLSDKIESVIVLGGARAYEVSNHRGIIIVATGGTYLGCNIPKVFVLFSGYVTCVLIFWLEILIRCVTQYN